MDQMDLFTILLLTGIIFFIFWLVKRPQIKWSHRKRQAKAIQILKAIRTCGKPPAYVLGMLRNIDPFVFEKLLLLCFKEKGYKVKHNFRYTGDGGIDGTVFNKQGQKLLIQAKRYRSAINPQHIAEFAAVIGREGAAGGFFIHTGRTGNKSKAAKGETIHILSGNQLICFVLAKA